MKVRIIKPFEDAETVAQIAIVYQQTFGNAPWNEGYKCPICETVTPLNSLNLICPACLKKSKFIAMIDYWPISKVISDFYTEMAKPESFCLTIEDKQVIGFAWGYKLEAIPATSVYLEAPGLDEIIKKESLDGKINFLYIDEVAISPEYQGQRLGYKLMENIFYHYPNEVLYLRTLESSAMFKLVTKIGGETILKISQGRVIIKITMSKSVFSGYVRD